MRCILALSLAVLVAGCASLPQGYWYRVSDGLRVDSDPALLQQFEIDKGICNGEAAAARLSSGLDYSATAVELVYRGCLNGKGYVIRD